MNVTEQQAQEAVCARFKQQWNILHPTEPISLPNQKFDQPSPSTSWARVVLASISRIQLTLGQPGGRTYEARGNATVWLYAPQNEGIEKTSDRVDDVRNIFEGAAFSGLHCIGAAHALPGRAYVSWWEVVVITPFLYHEQR